MCEYFHFIDEETNGGSKMLASGRGKTQTLFEYCLFSVSFQSRLFKENDHGVLNIAFVIGEFAVSLALGLSLGCVIGACHSD